MLMLEYIPERVQEQHALRQFKRQTHSEFWGKRGKRHTAFWISFLNALFLLIRFPFFSSESRWESTGR